MIVAALIIAVLALLAAGLAWSRATGIGRELGRAAENMQHLQAELKETRAAFESRLAAAGHEAGLAAGTLKFDPGMTIADAMLVDPRVSAVLAEYQLGGCSNCAVSDVDTLEGACRSYGIDQDGLMAALNRLLDPAAGGSARPIDVARMRVQM